MDSAVAAEAREKMNLYPLSAIEYAKIEAVKSRIAGLRMGMAATAITGSLLSFGVFLIASVTSFYRSDAIVNPVVAPVLVATPFVLIIGYLSYKIGKHTDRLSRGKFEPRIIFEED